jgi:TRAP-type mannitol/chloroaromatic compound transport system permease small subunit
LHVAGKCWYKYPFAIILKLSAHVLDSQCWGFFENIVLLTCSYLRKNDHINLFKHYDEVNTLIQILKGMALCGGRELSYQ